MGLMLGDKLLSLISYNDEYGSSGGDVVLTRFSDDSGNEIGTHFMSFTDRDGIAYKVICLDAAYRKASCKWLSSNVAVTDMPMYSNLYSSFWYRANESATKNCDLIKAFCEANSYTSTAVDHCRSQSFVIGGTTYYEQMPNIKELLSIYGNASELDKMDTSTTGSKLSSLYASTNRLWSSTQNNANNVWVLNNNGYVYNGSKANTYSVAPVLEIPIK